MGEQVKIYDLAQQMSLMNGLTIKDKKNPKGESITPNNSIGSSTHQNNNLVIYVQTNSLGTIHVDQGPGSFGSRGL